MSLDPNAPTGEPPRRYVPSGRVNLIRFVPLVAAGLAVSAAMAFALLLVESWLYIYLIMPIALGLPVYVMVWLAARWGRCRNPGIGGFVGLVMAFAYYAGYWELSYLTNVASRGPAMVAIVERVGGLPGLPGYVVFRCKTSQPVEVGRGAPNPNRPPGPVDLVFNGIFFGFEAVLISMFAVGVGRSTSSRVYSERLRRWASSTAYPIPAGEAGEAADAIRAGDWSRLAAIPRVPKSAAAGTPVSTLTLESLPGEPAYVTLRSRGLVPAEFNRRLIPADQMADLARALHDPGLEPEPEPESSVDASRGSTPPTALEESLARLGLATPPAAIEAPARRPRAKEDFRARAVAASLAFLGDRAIPPLATVDASLCLPASEDGARRFRRASWAFSTWMFFPLIGQFGTLGGCLALSAIVEGDALSEALAAAGIVGFLVFTVLLFVLAGRGLSAWRGYLVRRVGDRPGSPLGRPDEPPSAVLALEDGETFHKPKLLGDDFAIVFFDHGNRRIIVEGLTHRYVIRAEDVVRLQPQPTVTASAARVDCRVGGEPLALVFATTNIWKQLPFGGRRAATRVEEDHLRRFLEVLPAPAPDC